MAKKWIAWSQDERSGRWLAVSEGSRADMTAYVERMRRAAEKAGITAGFAVLPEGTEPLAIR